MTQSSTSIWLRIKSAARENGASAFVDQGIISGFNFVTFLLLARWMETVDFGLYVLLFSALMFIQTVQHALITRAHNVLGVQMDAESYGSYTRSVFLMMGGLALAATLVVLGFAAVFFLTGLQLQAETALALSLALIPWLIQDGIRRILYSDQKVAAAALNGFVSYSLQAGLILTLFLQARPGTVLSVFAVLGASSLIAAIVGIYQIRGHLTGARVGLKQWKKDVKRTWEFGRWLTTGEFVGWIGQNGNTWLIAALLGAPLVAGYRAATYVTNLLNPVDLAVANYLPVEASRILHDEGRPAMLAWLRRKAFMFCIPYAFIALVISLGARELLDLFYDDRYVSGLLALVLSLAVWGRFLGFLVNFSRLGLIASERTRPILVSQAYSLLMFALFSTVLISVMGITGAPVARVFLHLILGWVLTRALLDNPEGVSSSPALVAKEG